MMTDAQRLVSSIRTLVALRGTKVTWIPNLPDFLSDREVAFLKRFPSPSDSSKTIVHLAPALQNTSGDDRFYICKDNPNIRIENVLFAANGRRGCSYTVRSMDGLVVVAIAHGAIPDDLQQVPRLPHTYLLEAMDNSGLTILHTGTDSYEAFDFILSHYATTDE